MLRLSDFDYTLPPELIAQYPLPARDAARLLVVDRAKGTIKHRSFRDVLGIFRKDDLLVLNDTKVLPSRILGKRASGGKVELLLLQRKTGLAFEVLIKPARVKLGEEVLIGTGNVKAKVTAKNEVTFSASGPEEVYALGVMPLPPYIRREPEPLDIEYYQTVYARSVGAVASPTAGLHFTESLLHDARTRGVHVAYLTLHVGYATFKPVKEDDVTRHAMDPESFSIPDETIQLIKKTRQTAGRIIAVGTTSCRALETFGQGRPQGQTNLFIYPGFQFTMTDCLLTNFHLPRTTLFMLVCAFAGEGFARQAYKEAIELKYRFYSYGDAMLVV